MEALMPKPEGFVEREQGRGDRTMDGERDHGDAGRGKLITK